MAKQRRNYTREFKTEAVRRIAAEGKSLAEVARELGLGESLLRSWKTALAADGEQAFPGKGNLPAVEEELRRLRAENQKLRMEREILKKATASAPRSSGEEDSLSLETFRRNPAGGQSRPAELGQQPEASLAWWTGNCPCEA